MSRSWAFCTSIPHELACFVSSRWREVGFIYLGSARKLSGISREDFFLFDETRHLARPHLSLFTSASVSGSVLPELHGLKSFLVGGDNAGVEYVGLEVVVVVVVVV